jgi:hypothetical protein
MIQMKSSYRAVVFLMGMMSKADHMITDRNEQCIIEVM